MKKLFVILLLVALVPFTTGCNGLWDFDSDNDSNVAYTTLTSKATLPSAAISAGASIRGAASYTGLTMKVGNITLPATGAVDNGDGTTTVTFTKSVTTTEAATVTGNVPATVSQGATAIVTVTLTLGTSQASQVGVVINGTVSATGVLTVTSVSATYVPTGSTTATTATTTVTATGTITVSTFKVTGVAYGATALTTTTTNAPVVNVANPSFAVTFDKVLPTTLTSANTTWTLRVTNESSTTTPKSYFDLTNTANSALFTVAVASNVATIKLNTDTAKKLTAGKTYSVQLLANNIKDSAGTLLDTPQSKYYFTTGSALATTVTTLSSVTDTIASGTGKQLTLTFSAAVKSAPEAGSTVTIAKTGGSTVTLTSTSSDITITQPGSTSQAVITINKAITAGTYTVSVTAGEWKDLTGNPVETSVKTFTVN